MKIWICRSDIHRDTCITYLKEPDGFTDGFWNVSCLGFVSKVVYMEKILGMELPPYPELLEVEMTKARKVCTWLPEGNSGRIRRPKQRRQ